MHAHMSFGQAVNLDARKTEIESCGITCARSVLFLEPFYTHLRQQQEQQQQKQKQQQHSSHAKQQTRKTRRIPH